MTRFLSVMPVLKVADLKRSLDWYTNVLGFQADTPSVDDGGGELCFVRAGDVEFLLATGAHLGGTPAFTGVHRPPVRPSGRRR